MIIFSLSISILGFYEKKDTTAADFNVAILSKTVNINRPSIIQNRRMGPDDFFRLLVDENAIAKCFYLQKVLAVWHLQRIIEI